MDDWLLNPPVLSMSDVVTRERPAMARGDATLTMPLPGLPFSTSVGPGHVEAAAQ
ncbi:MAG TPA: hypothetical protein VJU15_02905 [Gemmatimonadales bacterium]|nr:hypothetical protein [Gemmatimonadales bacterium]